MTLPTWLWLLLMIIAAIGAHDEFSRAWFFFQRLRPRRGLRLVIGNRRARA